MDIYTKIDAIWDEIVKHRRWFHAHPELSGMEEKTAAYIAQVLRGMGLTPQEGIGGHGIVALIRGKGPGRCLGLRADMDALSIREETGLPYASENPGVCHACGHDMHMAMLLGAAQVLCDMKDRFSGTVKLIFQPSEENAADSGARKMIEDGVLENPSVDAIFAQHVGPHYPVGTVAFRQGSMSASSDRFAIELYGKSSHGSEPEGGVDAVAIGAQVISALQTIVSRTISAQDSAVLSIGTVTAGSRYNIIADSFRMEGTCRTLNPEIQATMPSRMERIIQGVTEGMGGTYSFRYTQGFCPVVNDDSLFSGVKEAAEECLGAQHVVIQTKAAMIGEDFSYFSKRIRECSIGWDAGRRTHLFTPAQQPVCPGEEAMRTGVAVMVSSALAYLK